jgi:hypothetical protein
MREKGFFRKYVDESMILQEPEILAGKIVRIPVFNTERQDGSKVFLFKIVRECAEGFHVGSCVLHFLPVEVLKLEFSKEYAVAKRY